ncbi:TPA: recombinase family protein [Salmonella enterica subsp. enterica serovar Virchow]
MIFGYVRVSTDDQTTENQIAAIKARYPDARIINEDATSGKVATLKRPMFKSMFDLLAPGDLVVTVAVDRIGRNTIDVLQTVEAIQAKGASVSCMREGFDLSTPAGVAMLTIIAAFAKMELAIQAERRAAGIKRAQAAGIHCGRPSKGDAATVGALFAAGKTWQEIASITGLSKSTIYRLKREAAE